MATSLKCIAAFIGRAIVLALLVSATAAWFTFCIWFGAWSGDLVGLWIKNGLTG